MPWFLFAVLLLCTPLERFAANRDTHSHKNGDSPPYLSNKKILWVSSYHQGYEANDAIEAGIRSQLNGSAVVLRTFFMDTKRNNTEAHGQAAAQKALSIIEQFRPDVIIASDDNAQKYLVVPYLKEKSIPIVFCGVNWDIHQYGYPTDNITGMIEVDLAQQMYDLMRSYAAGDKIGFLSGNVDAERKMIEIYNKRFFHGRLKPYLVESMAEFKRCFLQARQEVDMLYIYNYTGIKDWDPDDAELFLSRHTRIPTGSHNGFMAPFVTFVAAKSLKEHGRFAADAALQILSGVSPAKIAVTENKEVELYLNMRMAKAASFVVPVDILKTATVISEIKAYLDPEPGTITPGQYAGKKIFFLDSYHKEYEWSTGIKNGLLSGLYETGIQLRTFYLNAKQKIDPECLKKTGQKAYDAIVQFQPDVVIASDDAAQKYVISPYLKGKNIPVVFCGVNWDASEYGYPAANITGMIEEEPIDRLISLLQQFAKGPRLGYIAGNTLTQQKLVEFYGKHYFRQREAPICLVDSMAEWKEAVLKLQKRADMLILHNYSGIQNWDSQEAARFMKTHNTLPTGSMLDFMSPYVIFVFERISEEQGGYAANTALRILDGTPASQIPIKKNILFRLILNLSMAESSKITIPYTLLKQADELIQ
nr:ABC transporter substrate binding protein [uncultured Desulfobacter sp.]